MRPGCKKWKQQKERTACETRNHYDSKASYSNVASLHEYVSSKFHVFLAASELLTSLASCSLSGVPGHEVRIWRSSNHLEAGGEQKTIASFTWKKVTREEWEWQSCHQIGFKRHVVDSVVNSVVDSWLGGRIVIYSLHLLLGIRLSWVINSSGLSNTDDFVAFRKLEENSLISPRMGSQKGSQKISPFEVWSCESHEPWAFH